MKPINLKFCSPFQINIQKREELSNLDKPVFNFSLLNPRKNGLRRKSKVCSLNTQIKKSGLMISHSKVFSYGLNWRLPEGFYIHGIEGFYYCTLTNLFLPGRNPFFSDFNNWRIFPIITANYIEEAGKLYATSPVQLCDIVAPVVFILQTSIKK